MSVVYFGLLDIQPAPPGVWFVRLEVPQSMSVGLPCPGALKPREGLVLPALFAWPVLVSLGSSPPVAVTPDLSNPIQQVTLLVDAVEYTLRLLVAQDSVPCLSNTVGSTGNYADAVSIANGATETVLRLLEPPETLDSRAHALATFMALDRTVLFLSGLAMNETGPGRVKTTSECRDLIYPISPLGAFVRALCRVYLLNDMIELMRPILVELCEEATAFSLSKSLADQTIVASLSVRLWTAAVEIVTARMPLPFVIALEEAFRLNFPEIPTGSLLGAFLTASLVTASVAFASQDMQIPNISADSLPLLVRVQTAVVEALVASVDTGSAAATSPESGALVQGLGLDIRNKATPAFNALVAKCHELEAKGVSQIRFPAIERVSESSILERAAAVLTATILPSPPVIEPENPVSFLQLLSDFKKRAFELKSKHAIHSFHQYHLHHYSFGTHANPQGPTLRDTARGA